MSNKRRRYDTFDCCLKRLTEEPEPREEWNKEGNYMYMIRIKLRKGCDDSDDLYCYKVGYTEYPFIKRFRQIDSEFDCCGGVDPSYFLLVFMCKVNGKRDEIKFHKKEIRRVAKKYRVYANKKNGGLSKNCYRISANFYDIFKRYVEENHFKYWESKRYTIDNGKRETFDGKHVTKRDLELDSDVSSEEDQDETRDYHESDGDELSEEEDDVIVIGSCSESSITDDSSDTASSGTEFDTECYTSDDESVVKKEDEYEEKKEISNLINFVF
uniref:Uncharacterized protein n=1 Tax=viral metagenome TaxID=1070528 RepID=A0A6C0EE06_9ZZZZ